MKKIDASKFKIRSEIEEKVRGMFGLTTDPKECTIEGTRAELARLHLGHKTTFWGIPCVATDLDEVKEQQKADLAAAEKPNRGTVYEGGINLEKSAKKKIKE